MKKKTRIISIALMCAMVSGSLWGCRETEQEEPVNTELKVLTQSVQVPVEGGEAVIEFSLTDPVEGAEVTVRPFSEWAHDPVVSMPADGGTKGSITLTVDANPDYTSRTADVKVSYTEGDFNYTVPIVQAGLEPEFQITATDLTTYSAIVSVTPLDKDMPYFASLITKEQYSEFKDDNELFEYNYNLWVENFLSIEDFLANGLQKGDLTDTVTSLLQDTEYYIYAYGVDNKTGSVLTPLYKTEFKSETVRKIDIKIDIDVIVDGNNAELTFTPSDNTIPYFKATTTKTLLENSGATLEEQANSYIQGFLDFVVGSTTYDFFELMSNYGKQTFSYYSLNSETDYVAFAVAWDGGCNIISDVFKYEYKTEQVHSSDNELALRIWSPGSKSAFYEINTTNNDPYVLLWLKSTDVEGMNEEEIFEYLLDIYPPDDFLNSLDNFTINGNYRNVKNTLEASTSYCAVVFGYSEGIMTTAMQKVEFTTAAEGEITSANMDYFYKIDTYPELSTVAAGVYPQECGPLFYPGFALSSENQDNIKANIANKAAEEGMSVSEYLMKNAYNDLYATVLDANAGIELNKEYKLFAVGITEDGEYAQDFVFSEPFILTSTSSSTASPSQDIQTGSMTSEFSSEPNAHEDLIRQFNEYLKSR